MIAALRARLRPAGHHAFERHPLFAELAEHLELRVPGDKAPVQLRARAGRLDHHGDDAVPARGNQLQAFLS